MTPDSGNPETLTRREAIIRVSAMLGGAALVGQSAMLASCGVNEATPEAVDAQAKAMFSADEIALLDEIAETMLPETDTPGAKAAGVGPFMARMVANTYHAADQMVFRAGLATVNAASLESSGADFISSDPANRLALLEAFDTEQHEHMRGKTAGAPTHFFRMMKELALLGYFTSEIGYTRAMRYLETPGRYDPCVDYAPGEKIWASHA